MRSFFLLSLLALSIDARKVRRADAIDVKQCSSIASCQTVAGQCGGVANGFFQGNFKVPTQTADSCACSDDFYNQMTNCAADGCLSMSMYQGFVDVACFTTDEDLIACNSTTSCTGLASKCGGYLGNVISTGTITLPDTNTLACLCTRQVSNDLDDCSNAGCPSADLWTSVTDAVCETYVCDSNPGCQKVMPMCDAFLKEFMAGNIAEDAVLTETQAKCLCGSDYDAALTQCASTCNPAWFVDDKLNTVCNRNPATRTTDSAAPTGGNSVPTQTSSAGKLAIGFGLLVLLL